MKSPLPTSIVCYCLIRVHNKTHSFHIITINELRATFTCISQNFIYNYVIVYFVEIFAIDNVTFWLKWHKFNNKRSMGLDALLTKLLHQDNFHNLGRDPPHNASHKICKIWSISITSINLAETLPIMPHIKFEANRSINFRGDSV